MKKSDVADAVMKHSDAIIKTAYTYVRNMQDAEDIAQSTFLALCECRRPFFSDEHIKAWLIRTAINKSKNHLKSAWQTKRVPLDDNITTAHDHSSDSTLVQAVHDLDEKYRLVVHLYYYEGYSIKEIANITRQKASTVNSHLYRARQILKDRLGEDYFESV